MSPILALVLLLAPQEDDSKRAREAAFGLPGLQVKTAPAPAPDQTPPPTSFTTPRVKRTTENYKNLLDHNVFSPPRKKEAPKGGNSGEPPKPEPKTRKWVLTGIVHNAVEKRYEALIEEPAAKDSKFYKTGDAVAGVTITEVTFDQVSFKRGETPGVLKLNDSLSETVTGAGNGAAAPVKAEDTAEIDKARELLKKRNKRESVPDEAEEDTGKRKPK
jgi:type II secretion system (T2SS) protein C